VHEFDCITNLLVPLKKVCIKFPVSKLNCLDRRSSYKAGTPRTHRLMHINNTLFQTQSLDFHTHRFHQYYF